MSQIRIKDYDSDIVTWLTECFSPDPDKKLDALSYAQ